MISADYGPHIQRVRPCIREHVSDCDAKKLLALSEDLRPRT
jgi:hypothetical protein